MKDKLQEFQDVIGYRFQDAELLRQALTHSSYANEHQLPKLSDNERLEFLGDAVLEIIASEFLFSEHSDWDEGEMTKMRASIVCAQTMAFCARPLHLGDYLLLGKGEELTGGRTRSSNLARAMEAVIGALYLDGGDACAEAFIYRYVLNDIENMQLFFDSKTILQEMVQGQNLGELTYELVEESGPDHNKRYVVKARIAQKAMGQGEGHTKKAAEQEAAYQTILMLGGKDVSEVH